MQFTARNQCDPSAGLTAFLAAHEAAGATVTHSYDEPWLDSDHHHLGHAPGHHHVHAVRDGASTPVGTSGLGGRGGPAAAGAAVAAAAAAPVASVAGARVAPTAPAAVGPAAAATAPTSSVAAQLATAVRAVGATALQSTSDGWCHYGAFPTAAQELDAAAALAVVRA